MGLSERGYELMLLVGLAAVGWGYEVPEVRIEVHKPKGFTASIPDAPGIGLFSFNGNLNSDLSNPDVGTFSGEALEATGGRWVFSDEDTVLKKGDTLHYWVMVSVNRLGYVKDNLVFEYNGETTPPDMVDRGGSEPSSSAAPPALCSPSSTVVRGRSACAGQIIFEDNYDQISNSWQFEQRIPSGHPEYPFVSYQNIASIISVQDGKLRIAPTLLQTLPPHSIESIRSGTLDLFRGCTEAADACVMTASGSDILPPVVSGRATTKYSFTFKYGVVDIRAKLVRGDWLYPELLLEPFMSKYGREHFSSGAVKVAMSRGNQELRTGQNQIGNKQLYGGVILDRAKCHDNFLFSKTSAQYWGNEYHTYSVRWEPDRLIWSVDGVEYGRLEAPAGGFQERLQDCPGMRNVFQRWALGTKMAPFDEEFYLTIGLAAGGITEFPDNSITSFGRNKPWTNLSSKAKLHFWQDAERWHPTWNQDSVLLVDSVKVTAL